PNSPDDKNSASIREILSKYSFAFLVIMFLYPNTFAISTPLSFSYFFGSSNVTAVSQPNSLAIAAQAVASYPLEIVVTNPYLVFLWLAWAFNTNFFKVSTNRPS